MKTDGRQTHVAPPCADEGPQPRSPEVGDYIVIERRWSYEIGGPLNRVTAQKVYWPTDWRRSGVSAAFKDAVMFSGPEFAARELAEKLNSSRALHADEQRRSALRHQERVTSLVMAARASGPASPQCDNGQRLADQ